MSKRKDLINNINDIVNEMANVLSNPNTTLIGKEYFRTNSIIKIEELINDFLDNNLSLEEQLNTKKTFFKKRGRKRIK